GLVGFSPEGVGGVIGPYKSPYTKSKGEVDLAFAFFRNGALLCLPTKQISQICVVLSLPIASSRVISSRFEYCYIDATICKYLSGMAFSSLRISSSSFMFEKFKVVDFKRWKKMHFLLSSMSVVYVLTTPMPKDGGDNPTMEQVKKRAKWDNDDYVYKGLILNEHNNSSRYNDNKGKRKHQNTKTNPNKKPKVTCWKCGKPVHLKKIAKLVYYVKYVSEAYFVQDDDDDAIPNKRNRINPYELWTKKKPNLNYLRVWGCKAVVRFPNPKLKTLDERGTECIFFGYAKHFKSLRFYAIEHNDSVAINLIIESTDAIFDEHMFSSVPRPSQRSLEKGTGDSGGLVVPENVTEEVVQQPKPELRKRKRHRTPKDFGPEF
nr:zinc finger, CCHC-type [Tanacetum cinerariifolium]